MASARAPSGSAGDSLGDATWAQAARGRLKPAPASAALTPTPSIKRRRLIIPASLGSIFLFGAAFGE
jgi:hypothetical protein